MSVEKWLPAETWAVLLTMPGLNDEGLSKVDAIQFNAAMI
jgi:hypothetical protein